MYELRPHQVEAKQRIRGSFGSGSKRPILQASTGFGKTLLAIDIIHSALEKGKRVLFVVDRITLIEQTSEEFDKYGIDHGIIQGDHWRFNPAKPVQLASAQTIGRRRNKPEVDLIIVDECHSVYKSVTKLITETFNNLPVIGLSATPFTAGLGKIYDDLIVVETTQSLIDKGFLADFVAYGPSAPDLSQVKTVAGDYNQKQLVEVVKDRKIVGDVVKTWLKLGQNRQTVCFSVNVAHSLSIVDEFKAHGVTAAHIDAYTDSEVRDEIFAAHNAGEVKVLSNCGITTKGWDSPQTGCIILARPTKSLMLYIQMVGRVLRTHETKDKAIILDHGSNIERLGFPTDPLPEYLCNGDREEAAKKKKEKEEKEKLPTPCPACKFLSTEFVCPACGHVPAKPPGVSAESGDLKKITKADMQEKVKWLGMFMGYARSHGYKDGWASHKYREKFGVWPAKKTGVHAVTPDKEVRNYITHLNIKYRAVAN